jgi:hypothetical protein
MDLLAGGGDDKVRRATATPLVVFSASPSSPNSGYGRLEHL